LIEGMPKPRPPHLRHETTRHGKRVWYVRLGDRRIRLGANFGTEEFWREYHAAISGVILSPISKTRAGTLAWLIERYRETSAWLDLSQATRRNRENHFKKVIESSGNQPFRAINQAHIEAAKNRRAQTPAQARNFLDAMRGLFKWAKTAQHVSIDPTAGVASPKRKKGDGFPVWTEADVEAYYKRWPIGAKERVWLDVLLFTGLRRGDAVVIGRQHVRDGAATLRTEKSQRQIAVTLPILPVLQRTLDAGPIGELAFICGKSGKPLTKESFGNAFKDACKAAGLHNRSAHGCRKIGATRAAENGATVAQLNAIFGWRGTAMASLYTEAADRKRLALEAMQKVQAGNESETNSAAPSQKVRRVSRKMY
jgi:integrase